MPKMSIIFFILDNMELMEISNTKQILKVFFFIKIFIFF